MPTEPRLPDHSAIPLLITADPGLENEVRRLAAAAGVGVERVGDPGGLTHRWVHAPVVLIGSDVLPQVLAHRPARRPDVHVLSPGAPVTELFRDALALGAETVTELPQGDRRLIELLTDSEDGPSHEAGLVGVLGSGGGVGASTLATALALEASHTRACLLIDADPCGGGIEQLVGAQGLSGVRWDALTATGRLGGRALREALPQVANLGLLVFPTGAAVMPPVGVVRETVSAARRGFETVVVDLGRHRDPAVDVLIDHCDRIYLITTLTIPAVAAGSRLRERLPPTTTRLVVRGPDRGVDATTAAELLKMPLVATMRDQAGLDEAVVLGVGPVQRRRGPLARTARRILDDFDGRAS